MDNPAQFASLYAEFDAPITSLDCGTKCAPYNNGIPVCCDTRHAVPTAYSAEWHYLQVNTDLWHLWIGETHAETARLQDEAPHLILIECLGHQHCQRNYRSLTCRAFPFAPYLNSVGQFLGLTYYWEYEDRCWVISNLDVVTDEYRRQFVNAFERVFDQISGERDGFAQHSAEMRRVFAKDEQMIPLLHRDGGAFYVNPTTETLSPTQADAFPKYDPFAVMDELRFPDEI